jgi:hypothetical protein
MKATQHGVHSALPAATGALEKLQHVRVKAHGDVPLVSPGRRIGAGYPIGGNPVPRGIASHICRKFLLGWVSIDIYMLYW